MIGMTASNMIWNLAMQFRNLAKDVFQFTVDLQLMRIQLEGLVARDLVRTKVVDNFAEGLKRAGTMSKELYDWLVKLAITTPFTIEDVNRTMLLAYSYGFTSDEVKKLTTSIAIFGSGMGLQGAATQRIIENLGQMRAAGKLTGTELRDLARGSFVPINDILAIMGQKFHLTAQQVRDLGRFGQKIPDWANAADDALYEVDEALKGMPVDEFIGAFEYFVEQNFPGALDRMSGSFTVAASNAWDLARNIGSKVLTPAISAAAIALNELVTSFYGDKGLNTAAEKAGEWLGNLTKKIFRFGKLGTFIAQAFGKPLMDIVSYRVTKGWNNLLAIGPIGTFMKALMPITGVLGVITRKMEEGKSISEIMFSLGHMGSQIGEQINGLWVAINAGNIPEFIDRLKKLGETVYNIVKPAFQAFYKDAIEPLLVKAKLWVLDSLNAAFTTLGNLVATYGPGVVIWIRDQLSKAIDILANSAAGASEPVKLILKTIQDIIDLTSIAAINVLNPPTVAERRNGGIKQIMADQSETSKISQDIFTNMAKLADIAKIAIQGLAKELLAMAGIKYEDAERFFTTIKDAVHFIGAEAQGAAGLLKILDAIIRVGQLASSLVMPKIDIGKIFGLQPDFMQGKSGKGWFFDLITGLGPKLDEFGTKIDTWAKDLPNKINAAIPVIILSLQNMSAQIVAAVQAMGPIIISTFDSFLTGGGLGAGEAAGGSVTASFQKMSDEVVGASIVPTMMQLIYISMYNGLVILNAVVKSILASTTTTFSDWSIVIIGIFQNIGGEVNSLAGKLANLIDLMSKASGGKGFTWTPNKVKDYGGYNPLTSTASPSGKASGGDVFAGVRYVVGEKGPEIFIPKYPGFIVPNSQIIQALKLTASQVATPMYSRGTYNNNSSQMNFYGPMNFSVPSEMDLLTLLRGS